VSCRSIHEFVQARLRKAPDSAGGGGDLPYESFRDMVDEPWMLLTAWAGAVLVGVSQGDPKKRVPSSKRAYGTAK